MDRQDWAVTCDTRINGLQDTNMYIRRRMVVSNGARRSGCHFSGSNRIQRTAAKVSV